VERVRGYKYRAYPDKKQQEFFSNNFGSCRFVYNHYLAMRKTSWTEDHVSMSYTDTAKDLTHNLKKEYVWLKEADSSALQQSLRHLDNAYKNYFAKRAGYPKFKRKRSDQSYRTMNNNDSIRIEGDAIRLPKAGKVKVVNTRGFEGRIISATVSRTSSGRYYISLQVEEEYEILPNNGGKVGIDAGLTVLYTDSENNKIESPRPLSKHEKRIRRLQRELSRKKKGSRNRDKARKRLAREHEKVADIRNDFQHKVSYRLASDNQVVCIEDLNVKGMMKNHRLAKSISDASWSEFFRKLGYKMADRGGILIKVPRTYPSSQRCNCCGRQNRKVRDLTIRNWTCPACGTKHDRDMNAAVNILAKGLEMIES
jgi:putative transposase